MKIAVLPLDGCRVGASCRNWFFLTMVSPIVVFFAVALTICMPRRGCCQSHLPSSMRIWARDQSRLHTPVSLECLRRQPRSIVSVRVQIYVMTAPALGDTFCCWFGIPTTTIARINEKIRHPPLKSTARESTVKCFVPQWKWERGRILVCFWGLQTNFNHTNDIFSCIACFALSTENHYTWVFCG